MAAEAADSRPAPQTPESPSQKGNTMSRDSLLYGDSGNGPERVFTIPAAGTSTVNPELSANKLNLITFATSAVTLRLPQAVGSGDRYVFRNLVTRTSGALTFQLVNTASVFNVNIKSYDSTAVATDTSMWFSTNATQIALNITTTGGLGGDEIEFIDAVAGTWVVKGDTRCSGDKVTPLS